jgi:hypothetical protein
MESMTDKVIRYPFRAEALKRENRKNRRVPCVVSERWLQFPKQIDRHSDADYIHLDVMTKGAGEEPRKICEVIVTKEELMSVLEELPVKDWAKQ